MNTYEEEKVNGFTVAMGEGDSSEEAASNLEARVNRLLEDGWHMRGDLAIQVTRNDSLGKMIYTFCQEMVSETDDDY